MAKPSSLAQNLVKELECAVCLEQYKEPKVLPCLHSYCKKCLEGLLTKQGEVWRMNCPSCRISVEVSSLKCLICDQYASSPPTSRPALSIDFALIKSLLGKGRSKLSSCNIFLLP